MDTSEPGRHCACPHEERWNAWSHGLGAVLAGALLCAMLWVALGRTDPRGWISALAHGGSLMSVMVTSAVYHAMPLGRWKDALQVLDHLAIYGLIAGTTTPVALLVLDGWTATGLLGIQALLACVGITLKLLFGPHRYQALNLALYLGMGWSGLLAVGPLAAVLPWHGSGLLVAGGLCYSAGLVFFVWESLHFNHFWWHLLVLAGATCHGVLTLGYLLAL